MSKNIYEKLLKRKGGRRAKTEEQPKKNTKKSYAKQTQKPKETVHRQIKSVSKEIIVKIAPKDGKSKGHIHNKEGLNGLLHYLIQGTENKEIYTNNGLAIDHDKVNEMVEICSDGFKESPSSQVKKNRLASHIIISLPNNVENYSRFTNYNDKKLQEILFEAGSQTIAEKYPLNDFFVAVQDNKKNLHLHIPIMCKSHDGRKIAINKKDIQELRESLVDKLKYYNIELKATSFLDKNYEKKPKLKRVHIEANTKPSKMYQEKVPRWCHFSPRINKFYLDSSKFNNQKEKNKFDEIFDVFQKCYKDRNKAMKLFLLMYKEDKRMATWSLDKNPKIFGTLKEKNIKIPLINIRNINTNLVVDRSIILDR